MKGAGRAGIRHSWSDTCYVMISDAPTSDETCCLCSRSVGHQRGDHVCWVVDNTSCQTPERHLLRERFDGEQTVFNKSSGRQWAFVLHDGRQREQQVQWHKFIIECQSHLASMMILKVRYR